MPGEDRAMVVLGYKNEMESMLARANPGLVRRFQMDALDCDDQALLVRESNNVPRLLHFCIA